MFILAEVSRRVPGNPATYTSWWPAGREHDGRHRHPRQAEPSLVTIRRLYAALTGFSPSSLRSIDGR
jgi:hypothetical protein